LVLYRVAYATIVILIQFSISTIGLILGLTKIHLVGIRGKHVSRRLITVWCEWIPTQYGIELDDVLAEVVGRYDRCVGGVVEGWFDNGPGHYEPHVRPALTQDGRYLLGAHASDVYLSNL